LINAIDSQKWLDRPAEAVQHAIHSAVQKAGPAGTKVANFLHGTWLRHPLHPALTDVPVGAWTAAAALDIAAMAGDSETVDRCARGAITVGLAGATGAALSGLMDWHLVRGRARRVGFTHALLNVGAVLLYGGSLVARRRGATGVGRGLAFAGFGLAGFSAYLGGDLVYEQRLGVDHASGKRAPADWTPVIADADLQDGRPTRVDANGTPVLLLRRGERIYAIVETCTHLGGPLSDGKIEGEIVQCPWHGSRFSLATGRVVDGPAVFDECCMETRVRDGWIEVRAAGSGEMQGRQQGQPREMAGVA